MTFRPTTDHNEIENPAAYQAAIAANNKRNAAKTRRAKWLAVEGNSRLYDWLNQTGEFKETVKCSEHTYEEHLDQNAYNPDFPPEYVYCDYCQTVYHPLVKGMFSGDFGKFLRQMQEALLEWGGLTDKQTEIVRNALVRAEKWEAEKQAKYAAKREEELAASAWVGEVGNRQDFTLTVERTVSYDNDYGTTYINVCKTAEGAVVVYKGSAGWNKSETLKVKATVKEHSEYNGVKQTIIQRPKVL